MSDPRDARRDHLRALASARRRANGTLAKILDAKNAEVARMLAGPPFKPRVWPTIEADRATRVDRALARGPGDPLRLIAEVKLRSPSAGALSRALAPDARAIAYAEAGAAMVSVLCDRAFFDGGFEHLAAARRAFDARGARASRPLLLCKEFILHPVQLDRAMDAGADAVLLIARITFDQRLGALMRGARERGLTPLVEVVTRAELDLALANGATLIGVNARDLDTLQMDHARARDVLDAIPEGVTALHLSGLSSPDDIARVAKGRADGALVGEALMRRDDPRELLRAMVAAAHVERELG